MKTITVERNFRISNDDPYLKERLFLTREVPDEVDEDEAMNTLRNKLIANFKAAYPKVYTNLNFDEVIQVSKPANGIYDAPPVYTNKDEPPQFEEPIDNSFNLIEIINRSTTLKELNSNKYLLKTDEEKKAFKDKAFDLEAKWLDEQRKTSNSINQ